MRSAVSAPAPASRRLLPARRLAPDARHARPDTPGRGTPRSRPGSARRTAPPRGRSRRGASCKVLMKIAPVIELPPRSKKLSRRPMRSTARPPRPRSRAAPDPAPAPSAAPRTRRRWTSRRTPAAPCGPPCRWRSAAAPPAARRPTGPCTPAARREVRRAASAADGGSAGGNDVGDQPPVHRRGGPARHHHRLAHRRRAVSAASISPSSMRKPRIFTWWSSAAQVLDARRPPGSRARSPVRYSRAPGSPERIGHEALGGQLGPVEVAARHLHAADVQLAGHADRHRLPLRRRARRAACWRSAGRSAPTARVAAAARPRSVTSTAASVGP